MKQHNCERCKFRSYYDNKPTSILGRIWRWHSGWCPGWSKYLSSLPMDEQKEVKKRMAEGMSSRVHPFKE